MNSNYFIQITDGDYTATYTIYYGSVNSSNIATLLGTNLPAEGISLDDMLNGVRVSVPGTTSLVILVGDGYCKNSIEFNVTPTEPPPTPTDLCMTFITDNVYNSWQFTPSSSENGKTKWEATQNGRTYSIGWNPLVFPNRWEMSFEPSVKFISINNSDIPDSAWVVEGFSDVYDSISNLNVIQGTCPVVKPLDTTIVGTKQICSGTKNCTGFITVLDTVGGTPPYSYSLDNRSETVTTVFENVCPGIHTVVTTDSNGLTTSDQITIEDGDIPVTYTINLNKTTIVVTDSIDRNVEKTDWTVSITPTLPTGVGVSFELLIEISKNLFKPGDGNFNYTNNVFLDNVLQTPTNTNTTNSTSPRIGSCSSFNIETSRDYKTYNFTLYQNSVLNGTFISDIEIPQSSSQFVDGCVTQLQQGASIQYLNVKYLGPCSTVESPKGESLLQNTLISTIRPDTKEWREWTYECQITPNFEIVDEITNLSSPGSLYYQSSPSRLWVADYDDYIKGNLYYFNPITDPTAINKTYPVPGLKFNKLYDNFIDEVYKKIYFVGKTDTNLGTPQFGGLGYYDINTNQFTEVTYGINNDFSRRLILVTNDYLYCQGDNTNTESITGIRVQRSNPTIRVPYVINDTTDPQNYLRRGAQTMTPVSSNRIWVVGGSGGNSVGKIAIFDQNLQFLSEITLPNVSSAFFNRFWQTAFFDSEKGYYYVSDIGSNQLFRLRVSNGQYVTNSMTTITYDNITETKNYGVWGWSLDPSTGELYGALALINDLSDTAIRKQYLIDRDTGEFIRVIYDLNATNLRKSPYSSTNPNAIVGLSAGLFYWSSQNPSSIPWNTDGTLTFYDNTKNGQNTGLKVVKTLRLWNVTRNEWSVPEEIKNNVVGTLGYIADSTDLTDCPIDTTPTCGDLIVTVKDNLVTYEIDVPIQNTNNTTITKIKVINGSQEQIIPKVNGVFEQYYQGSFSLPDSGSSIVTIQYLDANNQIVISCNRTN
jgi:hypothetical protein